MSETEQRLPLEGIEAPPSPLDRDLKGLEDRFGPPQSRDPLPDQPALGLGFPVGRPESGPNGERVTTCKSCGAGIYWSVSAAGKRVPIALATGESHFRDCPDAARWTKRKGKG